MIMSVLLCGSASALPDPAALMREAMPAGFAPVDFGAAVYVPVPQAVPTEKWAAQNTDAVSLSPLLDRHLSTTDSFVGAGGKTLIGGNLDIKGDGYLSVTPPGQAARFIKIERTMSGTWHDGVNWYKVSLSINVFRPRLANYIVLRNTTTGKVVWEKRISELFRLVYLAGSPVTIAGRPYRLFYSSKPTFGLAFIYDEINNGVHDYKFYMIPMTLIHGASPTAHKLYGGDVVKLLVSADYSTLSITR